MQIYNVMTHETKEIESSLLTRKMAENGWIDARERPADPPELPSPPPPPPPPLVVADDEWPGEPVAEEVAVAIAEDEESHSIPEKKHRRPRKHQFVV